MELHVTPTYSSFSSNIFPSSRSKAFNSLLLYCLQPFEAGYSLFQLSVTPVRELISSTYVKYKSSLLALRCFAQVCPSLPPPPPPFFFGIKFMVASPQSMKVSFIIILSKKYNCRGVPLPGWHWQPFVWLLTFQENHLYGQFVFG